MNLMMEEKKYAVYSRGNVVARAYFLFPRFAAAEKINGFYSDMAEGLRLFFEKNADLRRAEYEEMDRVSRRTFEPLCVRLFSSVEYADEKVLSVAQEYVVYRGKTVVFYRKLCQVWQTEREVLLPAKRLFPRRAARKAEKNEFYFDGEHAVIVENLFGTSEFQTVSRARLCDLVRKTEYAAKKL